MPPGKEQTASRWEFWGLKSCDTCRKAQKWIDETGLDTNVRDVRNDGLEPKMLTDWLKSPLADKLLNKRSTTWRQLSQSSRDQAKSGADPKFLVTLLAENPTLLKRPVLVRDGKPVAVGFNEKQWSALV